MRKILMSSSLSVVMYFLVIFIIEVIFSRRKNFIDSLEKIEKDKLIGHSNRSKKFTAVDGEKELISDKLQRQLAMAGINLRYTEYLALWIGAFIFPFLIIKIITGNSLVALVAALIGLAIPPFVVKAKKKSRLEKFNNQLGDTLMILSNSLRAGFTFEQALTSITRDLPDPIGTEFLKIVREVELGKSMEESMEEVAIRMESDDMELMNTAVAIQRQVGGNLADVLDNIGETIRDRVTMKKKIKALTAQGEISGKVIAVLPILLLVTISFLNPEYMEPMLTTPFGYMLLTVSAVLETVGYLMIKKLINIEM